MNRLKYIFSINAPRHVPSNAAITSRCQHRNDASLQRRSSKPRALKTSRSASLEARRSHGIEGASRAGAFSPEDAGIIGGKGEICLEQRPKRAAPISARVLSLDRKFVLASLSRSCHSCSVAQIANTDNGASNGSLARNSRAKGQSPRQYSKDSTNASFSTFEEKDPPSYAQMIANYSESVYIKTSPGVLSDDLSASIGNVTRRSPFSTLSTIASTDSTVHRDGKTQNSITRTSAIAVLDEGDMEIGKKPKEQQAAQNTEALIAQRTNKKTSDDGGTSSNPTEAPRTYAKMIADYSNTMDFCCVPNPAEKSYICKCVSRQTPCENLSPYPLDKRSNCRTKTTVSQSGNASHPMNQSNATMEVDTSKQDWLKKVENVIKDLRNVTVKRETRLAKTAPRTKDANPPEPEDTRIPWFDRVVKANKRRTNETETSRKISPSSNNPSADPKKHSDAWKHDSLQKYKPDINATNRSFSERLNRRSRSTSSKKDSSQTSSTTQEPRVELRMAPSNKESIVSVNVDNVSRRALDLRNPDAKELSVIVHSKRNENSRTNVDHESGLSSKSQEAAKFSKQEISGHGSLRVSISEDFVPVKRLEFSINGEPVSEVRSITARTEKLEVVSSLDKFEVRVPFTRAQASNQRAKNLTNLASNADSVLNIQISAKFQQSRAEGNVDLRGETRTVSNPKSAEASNVVNRVYRASDRIDGNRFGAQVGNDIRETVVRESPIFAKHEPEHRLEARNRAETTASESNWSSTPDNVKVVEHVDGSPKGTATVKQMSGSSTSIGSGNATNPSDQRTPSNMIPWWSSEDSFKRIKRKGNIKQAVAIMSEKKLAENPKEAQPLVKVTPPRSKDAFKLAAVAGKQPHSSKLATPSEAKSGPTSGKKFPKQGETIDTSTSDKVSSPKPMEKWRWFQPIANNPSVAEVEETRRNESSRDVKITKGDSKDYDNSISKEKQSDFISPSNAVNEHKQHPSKNISKSSANTGTTATAKDERKPTHDIKSNASNASKTRAVSDTDRASFPHLSQSPKGTNDGEGKTASQTRSEDTKSVKPAERSSNRSRSIKIDAAQREDPSTAGKPSIPKGAKQRLEETNARKESDDRKHYNANADASVTSAEYHKDATGKIVKNESASEALSEPISPRGKKKQQDIRVESNARNKRQSLTAKVRAEERDLISGRIEKEQRERASKKTRPADDAAKPRMKAIIESMRPIEKKKDGTLIDYGVKLPSRKGLNAGGKVSPDRSRVTIEINEVTTGTLPGPKNVPRPEKNDGANVSLASKNPMALRSAKFRNEAKKATDLGKKAPSNNADDRELVARKPMEKTDLKKKETISARRVEEVGSVKGSPNVKEPVVASKLTKSEKAALNGTLSKQVETKSDAKIPGLNARDPRKEAKSAGQTRLKQWGKISVEDVVITNKSKQSLTRLSDPKKIAKPAASSNSSSITQSAKVKKTEHETSSLGGSKSSQKLDKKSANSMEVPPAGVTSRGNSLKSNNKVASRRKESSNTKPSVKVWRKDGSITGVAPLAGTITGKPSVQRDKKVNARESKKNPGRQEPPLKDSEENHILATPNKGRTALGKDRGSSSGPAGTSKLPTGPAGVKSPGSAPYTTSRMVSDDCSSSFANSAYIIEGLNEQIKGRSETFLEAYETSVATCKSSGEAMGDFTKNGTQFVEDIEKTFTSQDLDRPEKKILYSVWLQRFENLDDEKIL